MNKIAIQSAVLGLLFMAPAAAFAYTLPAPVTATIAAPVSGGAGEVDLSVPSYVKGTVTVDNLYSSYWVTAGDVASGKAGYGFFISNDRSFPGLYAVTNDGNGGQRMMLLGFVQKDTPIKLLAVHDPTRGLTVCTSSIGSGWTQYTFGVTLDFSSAMRGLGAFYGSVADHSNPGNLFIGNWAYTPQSLGSYGSASVCTQL